MKKNDIARFVICWSIALPVVVILSAYAMPFLGVYNTVSGGSDASAKEALVLLKDSTIWMAGLQTATIAALGLLAKDGATALRLTPVQTKLAVLVVLTNSFALFFSAWLLTSLPSLMLRVYADKLPDHDFFNLTLYGFMQSYSGLKVFTVHYFAFWNHWLWGMGIVCFGALSVLVVARPRVMPDTSQPLAHKRTMRLSPHLCFDGQCREAMQLYQSILGGTLQTMLTYGESPMASSTDSRCHDRIVHATLVLDEVELTGADLLPGAYQRPQGFFVTLTVGGIDRAGEIFRQLSHGGTTKVPFEKTFWSPGFGVLVDRFGIPWEINTDGGQDTA